MGPKVTGLRIHLHHRMRDSKQPEQLDIIRNLAYRYPYLRDVSVLYGRVTVDEEETPAISTAVNNWNHLRTLEVKALSLEALTHVAALSELQELSFHSDGTTLQPAFPLAPVTLQLPAHLRILEVHAKDLSFHTELIRGTKLPTLEAIVIGQGDRETTSDWRAFFAALRDCCDTLSLRSITWENQGVVSAILDNWEEQKPLFTIDYLQPLLSFSFHRLTNVNLAFHTFDPDDLAVKDMAMAWPHIKYLQLHPSHRTDRQPRLTLHGLLPFGQYCKELEMLLIRVDALNPHLIDGLNPRPHEISIGQLPRLHLDVGDSPIADYPNDVANILLEIFPNIFHVGCGVVNYDSPEDSDDDDNDYPENFSTWATVDTCIRAYWSISPARIKHRCVAWIWTCIG